MDRSPSEIAAIVLGSEITDSGFTETLYRHSTAQIREYLQICDFESIKSLEFNMFMDRDKRHKSPVKIYVAMKRKTSRRLTATL